MARKCIIPDCRWHPREVRLSRHQCPVPIFRSRKVFRNTYDSWRSDLHRKKEFVGFYQHYPGQTKPCLNLMQKDKDSLLRSSLLLRLYLLKVREFESLRCADVREIHTSVHVPCRKKECLHLSL